MTQTPPLTDGEPAHARADDLPPLGWPNDVATEFVVPRWHWPPWAVEAVGPGLGMVLAALVLLVAAGDHRDAVVPWATLSVLLLGMYAGYAASERVFYGRRPWPFRERVARRSGTYWIANATGMIGFMVVFWGVRDLLAHRELDDPGSLLAGAMVVYPALYLAVSALIWYSPLGRRDRERFGAAAARSEQRDVVTRSSATR